MSQTFSGPDTSDWYAHSCSNYRASSDNARFIKAIGVGNEIKFRAGFKVFASGTAAAPTYNSSSSKLFAYSIVEAAGATALFASTAIAVTAVAQQMW